MQLTREQRVFVVTKFLQSGSIQAVQSSFEEQFPDMPFPTKTIVWKIVQKYRSEGISLNLKMSVRPQKTQENG